MRQENRHKFQEGFWGKPCLVCLLALAVAVPLVPNGRTDGLRISVPSLLTLLCLAAVAGLLWLSGRGLLQKVAVWGKRAGLAAVCALVAIGTGLDYLRTYQVNDTGTYDMPALQARMDEHRQTVVPVAAAMDPLPDVPGQFAPYRFMAYDSVPLLSSGVLESFGHRDVYTYMNPASAEAVSLHVLSLDKRVIAQNVRFLVTLADGSFLSPEMLENDGFTQVADVADVEANMDSAEANTLRVWRTTAMGEAWLVYDAVPIDGTLSAAQQVEVLNALPVDLAQTAVVAESDFSRLSFGTAPQESNVEVLWATNREVALDVTTDQPGLLATAEYLYPGWNVYVNGEKADPVRVNTAFIGVPLDAGSYQVILRYQPASVFFGAAVTLASAGIALSVVIIALVRYRKQLKQAVSVSEPTPEEPTT